MRTTLAGIFCAFFLSALPVNAQDSTVVPLERETLGYGRLFTNDFLGDGEDRWRTGSYAMSRIRGYQWDGERPEAFGDLLEFRLRAEILAPDNLVTPAAGDRRYAGALSLGMHTHFQRGQTEMSLGADLVVTGPQTGLGAFQREAHKLLDADVPTVLGNQIVDGFHPGVTYEAGRPFRLSETAMVRPFVEMQVGAEDLVRIGADMIIGRFGQRDLFVRDVSSGQLYSAVRQGDQGTSFVVGGDIAKVDSSIYLPDANGYVLTDSRDRLRAGVHWQGERTGVFYGLTWLGREFEAQNDSQIVGSINLRLNF